MPTYRQACLTPDTPGEFQFTTLESPAQLEMPAGEEIALLHVRWSLTGDEAELASLRPLLNENETRRADRFRVEAPRGCFILSWGILRILLGTLTGTLPKDISFEFGAHGKPFLPRSENPERLMFNLSHSGDDILFVLTRGAKIGVDIETVRERTMMDRIAERHYHPNEIRDLKKLEGSAFVDRFYEYWTLKEAWIKALGHGLSYPIATLDFSAVLPADGMTCHIENADWWCLPLQLKPGVPGALARASTSATRGTGI